MDAPFLRSRLKRWYRRAQRDLPWRRTRDPYRIWVAEVMLQQTRVAAVIPYYERFLRQFPDAGSLARASETALLAAWSGLGYYSRARNLQRAAQRIVEQGFFPDDYHSLRKLPGVGDYTAAAVASIAFGRPHAVLDGNVARVLGRLANERGDIKTTGLRKRLHQVAEHLLDRRNPGEFNQALMELGATICLPRSPQCHLCPLAEHCEARRRGTQNQVPLKSQRTAGVRADRTLLFIERNGRVLLWRRDGSSSRLAGFWELPEPEQLPRARLGEKLGEFRHSIVNHEYRVTLRRAHVSRVRRPLTWVAKAELAGLPLSTTAKKALACVVW